MFYLNSKRSFKFILSPFLLSALTAHAGGPSLNNKCSFGNINFPANSNAVLFDEECKNAYVLPVATGLVRVDRVSTTTHLGFCSAVRREQGTTKIASEVRHDMINKIKEMLKSYDPLREDIANLEKKVITLRAEMNEAEAFKDDYNKTFKEKLEIVDSLNLALAKLKKEDPQMSNPETKQAKERHDKALHEMDLVYDKYNESKINFRRATKDYDEYNEHLLTNKKRYSEAIKDLADIQKNIDDISAFAANQYKNFAQLEALTASLNFTIDTTSLVQKFKEQNSGLDLTWQPAPIKEALYNATLKDSTDDADNSVTALIRAVIPGIKSPSLKNIDVSSPSPSLNPKESTSISSLGNISGQVVLNLIGGCQYYDDSSKPIPGKDINAITSNLIMNVVYTYDAKVRRGYTAKYQLSNMLSRIQSQTRSSGWFSSRSVNELIEEKNSIDWFNIKFDQDAAGFNYSDAEQEQISKEVKANLIDRSLRQFAMFNTANPPMIPYTSPNGIMYVSAALGKCFHYYCQAGSFVLGTLGTIFGNSNATSIFQSKNNIWVTDQVSGVRAIERSGTVNFSSNGRN